MNEINNSIEKIKMAKTEEDIQKKCPFPCIIIKGLPFPCSPWYDKKNVEESFNLKLRDTDIIVVSYPKSGTNWLTYIIHSIITHGDMPFNHILQLFRGRIVHAETCGTKFFETLPDPRICFVHFPYSLCPKHPKAKYLYIVRNVKDVLVSAVNFANQFLEEDARITIDESVQSFANGATLYGNYFEHVLSWYEHRFDQNVLFIAYEQLQADIEKQVLRIAKFLGGKYYDRLQNDKNSLDKVLKLINFENMKKSMPFDVPLSQPKVEKCEFFRKGVCGDWKNYFSAEQTSLIDDCIEENFGDTDIIPMISQMKYK